MKASRDAIEASHALPVLLDLADELDNRDEIDAVLCGCRALARMISREIEDRADVVILAKESPART